MRRLLIIGSLAIVGLLAWPSPSQAAEFCIHSKPLGIGKIALLPAINDCIPFVNLAPTPATSR